ncbi:hypothetical protein Bhyg_18026 [Pseudolycoriella hygida]|uniref:Uncharacterized protein n=1 Tax=Pseudolycoriella hygida TaxID=35572 RepID=A0A9Q0MHS3_9DIPT|nr:hypothetical protein Bhyg_18026 [Pseudolycoriella hygida]
MPVLTITTMTQEAYLNQCQCQKHIGLTLKSQSSTGAIITQVHRQLIVNKEIRK